MRFLPFFLLALLCACSSTPEGEKKTLDASDKDTTGGMKQEASPDTTTIVNTELTYKPFAFDNSLLERLVSLENTSIKKEPVQNRHNKNQTDTIYKITAESDYFEVYKAQSKEILKMATIKTGRFPLKNGIKVGMSMAAFKDKIGYTKPEPLTGYVRLRSPELMQWVDVRFEGDKISAIKFRGYVD
jgi:hypothetical protein